MCKSLAFYGTKMLIRLEFHEFKTYFYGNLLLKIGLQDHELID